MKTIIAGSRTANMTQTLAGINSCPWQSRVTRILCGAALGVDTCAAEWAYATGLPVDYYEANWAVNGRAAGPIRNQQMVDHADALIAIWDGQSKGTADIIRRAKAEGITVHVFNYVIGEVLP